MECLLILLNSIRTNVCISLHTRGVFLLITTRCSPSVLDVVVFKKTCLGVVPSPPTQDQVIYLFTGLLDNHDRVDSPQVLSTSQSSLEVAPFEVK